MWGNHAIFNFNRKQTLLCVHIEVRVAYLPFLRLPYVVPFDVGQSRALMVCAIGYVIGSVTRLIRLGQPLEDLDMVTNSHRPNAAYAQIQRFILKKNLNIKISISIYKKELPDLAIDHCSLEQCFSFTFHPC